MSLRTIRCGMSSAAAFLMAVVLAMPTRAPHNAPRIDLAITYATTHQPPIGLILYSQSDT